jgi:hypothetical protein
MLHIPSIVPAIVLDLGDSEWNEGEHSMILRPEGLGTSTDGATNWQKKACTMCIPGASESVVPASDQAGLEMFSGEWRMCRGGARFESHLGHRVSAGQRGFYPRDVLDDVRHLRILRMLHLESASDLFRAEPVV